LALEEHSRKDEVQVPKEVLALVQAREVARARKDWSDADELRDRIASLGWQVQDTPDGPTIQALSLK
jgi:cysteinyl-tRNA synthetase